MHVIKAMAGKRFYLLLFLLFIPVLLVPFSSSAGCGGAERCECGNVLNMSQTMWYDLECPDYTAALYIQASGPSYPITLDCNGHTISGGYYWGSVKVVDYSSDVTITNCNITSGVGGITIGNGPGNRMKILNNTVSHTTSTGINVIANNVLIENNYLHDTGGSISITGKNFTIRDNILNQSGGNGITVWYTSQNVTIENNEIYRSYSTGVFINGQTSDIFVQNNIIKDNRESPNSGRGIQLENLQNATLKNNLIDNMTNYGILISGSDRIKLIGNTIKNTQQPAIYSVQSKGNNLIDSNLLESNTAGMAFIVESHSPKYDRIINNIIKNNTADGIKFVTQSSSRPRFYEEEIINNTIEGNSVGISLDGDFFNSTIKDNIIKNNRNAGISLRIISGNWYPAKNKFVSNLIEGNNQGFEIYQMYTSGIDNEISGNRISMNRIGISSTESNKNIVKDNFFLDNTEFGIKLVSSRDNLIFNNYFSNIINAQDTSTNFWNTTKTPGTNIIGGPFIAGNYWKDYRGLDRNGDKIGDTYVPHKSSGNITNGGDYLPLTNRTVLIAVRI